MRFRVFFDVEGEWVQLGTWTIDCSIAACDPHDLADAFLGCVTDALNTRAKWTQDSRSSVIFPAELLDWVQN